MIVLAGLAAGLLDLVPLAMVDAPTFNMVAIVFWLVAVLFMATTTLFENSFLNGLAVAVLVMLPVVLTVYTVNPSDVLPMRRTFALASAVLLALALAGCVTVQVPDATAAEARASSGASGTV